MAKSSIHIQAGKGNRYFAHNDRSAKTKNAIFYDMANEISAPAPKANKNFKEQIEKRKKAYEKNKGKKLHKNTVLHLSSIVNLEEHHTLDDLQPIVQHLERTLDTKVIQIAIHRDEGHIDKDGKAVKNYHAHIEFLGLDSEGMSVRRKLSRSYLSQLQSVVAHNLGMERGTNYAREKKPRPRRLDTYEYKRVAEAEARHDKASNMVLDAAMEIGDLKRINKELRQQLQELGAVREHYAKLEAHNKELVGEVVSGKKELKMAVLELSEVGAELKRVVMERNEARRALEVSEVRLEAKSGLEAKLELVMNENEDLKKENKELKSDLSKFSQLFSSLKDWFSKKLNIKIESVDDAIIHVKKDTPKPKSKPKNMLKM